MRINFRFVLFSMIVCAAQSLAFGPGASAQVDTDGDGMLDVIDAPEFNPMARVFLDLSKRGIQDVDGADQLTNLLWLNLQDNQVTSVDRGDFAGLNNLQWLYLQASPANGPRGSPEMAVRGTGRLQPSKLTNVRCSSGKSNRIA